MQPGAEPEHIVPEGIFQVEVDLEEPAASVAAANEESVSPLAASDASVIEEGVSHSDDIVEESTPAQEFVTVAPLPVETDCKETAADAPAEYNLPAVEDVSVGVEEEADEAPVVGEPSIAAQGNVGEEMPEAEVVEETLATPPAPTDETVVPPPVPDTPVIEGSPQAEFTAEARATATLDEETGVEGPGSLAPLQAPTETIVAPPAELDTPIVGEGIPQPDAAAGEPTLPIPEETIVEEPPLEIAAEESATSVPISPEGTETVLTVPKTPVDEEGISQAEVAAEGSDIPLSGPVDEIVAPPSAPAPVEERIPQAKIVEDSDAPLSAPADESVVPPSPALEPDHAGVVAVSTVSVVVPETPSEASAPAIIEEAAGTMNVGGPDGLVDEPLALVKEAPSAPVEIEGAEADPPTLVEPVANEETVTVEVPVPVESVLTVPQASKHASVPAVPIEDLAEADVPPVGADVNSQAEILGSLVEPAIAVAPKVPRAVAEPAVIEEQHPQDEDSPSPAPEGRTIPRSLLTSL